METLQATGQVHWILAGTKLPEGLAVHADGEDVVVNGVNDHAEVWDRSRWTEYWSAGLAMLPELTGGGAEA